MPGWIRATRYQSTTCPKRPPPRASWASCSRPSGRPVGRRVAELPVPGGREDGVGVLRLAATAVVAAQRHEEIAAFAVDVVAQYHAAEAQVGLHVEQLANIAVAD